MLCLAAWAAFGSGCSTVGIGDAFNSDLGSATYGRGELRSVERATVGEAWKATVGSVREMGYAIEKEQKFDKGRQMDVLGAPARSPSRSYSPSSL